VLAASSAGVAFSGGVDSSVLLRGGARPALGEALRRDRRQPLARAPRARLRARATAATIGAQLVVVRTDELDGSRLPRQRWPALLHCKRALFDAMQAWARAEGVRDLAFGEIADDLLEERPGGAPRARRACTLRWPRPASARRTCAAGRASTACPWPRSPPAHASHRGCRSARR
jgi:PP-loop superfamily ATP-utilizing enzyme